MRCCRVLGPLWAEVSNSIAVTAFVVQALTRRRRHRPGFVEIEHVQAGVGDMVSGLTEGNGARQILKQGDVVPIRSVIVGIVDHVETGT